MSEVKRMSTTPSNLKIIALHEVYFPVTNVAASVDWYTRHLGMSLVHRAERAATLRLAEGALLTLLESNQLNRYDSPPINFKAHDARKAHAQLSKAAVRAQEPDSFYHYVDFDVWDPDGNALNVISEPAFPDTPNNYFRIDGLFLNVLNFDQMLDWYADLLGAEIEYAFTGPTATLAEARYRCFRGLPFNLVESPASLLQHRVCEFETTDAEADYNYLHSKGVTLTKLLAKDGKRRFAFSDPEGREFGIVQML
jgi:catechol 2,3-dioxygenase-like lactoylglutathione lyase family enzyme